MLTWWFATVPCNLVNGVRSDNESTLNGVRKISDRTNGRSC